MVKTLKQKFQGITLLLTICIVMVGTVSIFAVHSMAVKTDGIVELNYKKIQAVDQMLEIIDRQDSAVLTYLGVDKKKGIDLFTEGMQSFLSWLFVLQDSEGAEDGLSRINEVKAEYDQYCKEFSLLQEELARGGSAAGLKYYNSKLVPGFLILKQDIRHMRDVNINLLLTKNQAVSRLADHFGLALLLLTALVSAAAYAYSTKKAVQLLNPLYQLNSNIRSITAGGGFHSQHLESNGIGEIEGLETEFNAMVIRLNEYEKSNLGKLLAEKEKLLSVMNNIEDAIVLVNADMQVQTMNPAARRLFDLGEVDVENRHLLELTENKEWFDILSELSRSDNQKTERVVPENLGDERVFRAVATRFQDSSWGEAGACGGDRFALLIQDITSITQTEKIRTDFIATLSHELKTPLTTIQMGASMLATGDFGALTAEQNQVVDAIKEDVDRITGMVENLVELSKVQSGSVSYQFLRVSAANTAGQMVDDFAERARLRGVALQNLIPQEIYIMADPEKLGWVFNNILSNALQYTGAGDVIALSGREDGDFAELCISDTGAGIPKENFTLIFEQGFHYNENNVETRGNGLGLYLSSKIVEAHSGKIWVESAMGKGSSFYFTVPCARTLQALPPQ